ncbi:sensor histidine kinase KdpD [Acidipila sp. EB88]|uniref:sensor histidine kinase n=1 Tax=Acidipila sp. EB88 TaxID=2305226 RepID=UPI000F5F7306|nr:HAMP domain-containing sensor histidine kinase [Acidipila sp. EB88]RRA47122.1 GHKL domain-containing protein [Acidipila sp. EB88]
MRITRRRPAIVLAILLGILLVGLAITLNVSWIVLNWRAILPLAVGIPVTMLLIAGVVLNTIFLVREVRRNDQQDSFLNAVTHELKTPIASIRLYLETLQRRPVPEEKRQEFYGIMLADSDRLLSTVEQILKAGEITQRSHKHAMETLDLRAVAESVTARVLNQHGLAPEAIQLSLCDKPLLVHGSLEDLSTAFGNLMNNAIKYSPVRAQAATMTVRVFADENGAACLEVTDHGIGIDTEHLKRIFKRFYRVPVRAVMRTQGTGLGLFLVQAIVKQHGGRISAESKGENRGSTFTARLPQLPESLLASGEKARKASQQGVTP